MHIIIGYLKNEETKKSIISLIQDNMSLYRQLTTEERIQRFADSIYNHFVSQCIKSNQYVSLSNRTISSIKQMYRLLIHQLQQLEDSRYDSAALEEIVSAHRQRLIQTLLENEYLQDDARLYIPCDEYSGAFQYNLLHLDRYRPVSPIMDIGCGKNHSLITFLEQHGYEDVHGIDQYVPDNPRITCANWFDFTFTQDTWGTVTAHMSFTNHCRRSLLTHDANLASYRAKYHEILLSLKVRGTFVYTPAVRPFEQELDDARFSITYCPNTDDPDLDTVIIQRLC